MDGLFSACKKCQRASQKRYRDEDPERTRSVSHNYYIQNTEKKRAYQRLWLKANPDKVADQRARGAAKKREAEKQRQKQHPEKKRITNQSRKARKRSLYADLTIEQWRRALEYFDNRCAVCNRPVGLWHTLAQDHWIPLSKGGVYTANNIIPLCNGIGGCNQNKKDKDPEFWLKQRYGERRAMQILRRIKEYFQWLDT
jgi:hypothetical protein